MTGHIGRAVIIIAALAFCSVILSFFLPLAKAFFYALPCSSSSFTYGVARLARIAGYTFAEAGASTLLAIAIGIPAAFLIARRSFPGRRLLASFAAIPLCVPPLIVALGYISSFGMSGHLNRIIALRTGGK
ncbi:MAG: iron ABC transporter permease, partial [Treponema sp.]|nr:iron ABC transporter permease [Treponema sp.]